MEPAAVLEYAVLGNPLRRWAESAAVIFALSLLLLVARGAIVGRLRVLAERTKLVPVQVAAATATQTKQWFLLLVAIFIGAQLLTWTPALTAALSGLATVALLVQIGLWASAAVTAYLNMRRRRQLRVAPGEVTAIDLLGFVLRAVVWTVVVLSVLDNAGVNVSTLIAGLGIGGVAIALAAQSVLGDLLASLSIVLDRPFVVGDELGIDDFSGRVEKVGLKTTRMRSQSGEQLIFSNTDLLASRIRNYGRMVERRVAFTLGVPYQTPLARLRRIPSIIRSVFEAEQHVRFERAHLQKYGDFALLFEVVYHVLSSDNTLHLEIQQRINFGIFERFAEEGIEFAYPTQTLHVGASDGTLGRAPRRSLEPVEDTALLKGVNGS